MMRETRLGFVEENCSNPRFRWPVRFQFQNYILDSCTETYKNCLVDGFWSLFCKMFSESNPVFMHHKKKMFWVKKMRVLVLYIAYLIVWYCWLDLVDRLLHWFVMYFANSPRGPNDWSCTFKQVQHWSVSFLMLVWSFTSMKNWRGMFLKTNKSPLWCDFRVELWLVYLGKLWHTP